MARFIFIRPWEHELMTVEQIDDAHRFVEAVQQRRAEQAAALEAD